jgi:hypothetical protein
MDIDLGLMGTKKTRICSYFKLSFSSYLLNVAILLIKLAKIKYDKKKAPLYFYNEAK